MAFFENIIASEKYRVAYHDGIHAQVEKRRAECDVLRANTVTPKEMVGNPEFWRNKLIEILGWPLSKRTCYKVKVLVCETIKYPPLPDISYQRLQIEILPGLPLYGILFLPHTNHPLPLVIAQHGGGGTPELMADLHGANNYDHIVTRILERNCAVFAPQLLLWNEQSDTPGIPSYHLKNDRIQLDAELRQLGGSIASLEIFALSKALDYLCTLPQINARKIGMIGLSYGGFYTQMLTAIDTRISVGVSSAFFNNRYEYCWTDFSWKGSAEYMMDAEICGLIAPRALCIHLGCNDQVFDVKTALPEIERLRPFFEEHHANHKLLIIVSNAGHKFSENGEEINFLFDNL
ncbi:MAG: alpha/beta hydrolase family protein [Christensenellales bacterium]|jgi:dienelactone hydrolase